MFLAAAVLVLAIVGTAMGVKVQWAPPDAVTLTDPSDSERVARGRKVYAAHCAACHGSGLEGGEGWDSPPAPGPAPAPPHDGTGHTWHHGDQLLFDYVKHGGATVAARLGVNGFESGMPGFGGLLSDAEIGAALAFIKSTWPPRMAEYQREATASETR